jgi:hypothetical protein
MKAREELAEGIDPGMTKRIAKAASPRPHRSIPPKTR